MLTAEITVLFRFLPYVGYVTIAMVRLPIYHFCVWNAHACSVVLERFPTAQVCPFGRTGAVGAHSEGVRATPSRALYYISYIISTRGILVLHPPIHRRSSRNARRLSTLVPAEERSANVREGLHTSCPVPRHVKRVVRALRMRPTRLPIILTSSVSAS